MQRVVAVTMWIGLAGIQFAVGDLEADCRPISQPEDAASEKHSSK